MCRLWLISCMLGLSACTLRAATEGAHQWSVRVIYASRDGNQVDPRLRTLSRQLSALKFSSYKLQDEATFHLQTGSAGRMELPNHAWLSLTPRGEASEGRLRLDIAMDPQFKTTVAVAAGATVAVGGPRLGEGTLILAVTLL